MKFTRDDDLSGAEFRGTRLAGARFVEADLSGVVARGCELAGLDLDSPWLAERDNHFLVNGVDVVPYVEAELDRQFPGRALRTAADPPALRSAWAALETSWAAVLERAADMPADAVDVSVDGEWSFAETLRHLVLATDVWLRKAVLEVEAPFHPYGKIFDEAGEDEFDRSVLTTKQPPYAEVLKVRAGRQAMVRTFIAEVSDDELRERRTNPWGPRAETTLSCLHVILHEEWEHLRYAVRDLDRIDHDAR